MSKEQKKLYDQSYYARRKEIRQEQMRAYNAAHPDEIKLMRQQWEQNNRPKMRAHNRAWYSRNREKVLARCSAYLRANPEVGRAKGAYYRAIRNRATLPRVDRGAIKGVYANAPKNCHVDHIIPLNHPDVCGLHVTWNLQYLTASDNSRKQNKFDGTNDNLSWRQHV